MRLKLFEILRDGPRSPQDLAGLVNLTPDAAARLLRAAASLRLLRALPDGRYALADLGASLLGNPSVGAFIEHHALLYDDLRDPVALLRGQTQTKLSRFWPYAGARPGADSPEAAGADFAAYSALMSRSQALVAEDILDAYPIAGRRCLLDVGGGEGAFIAAALKRAPGLTGMLFDLPAVAARAEAALATTDVGARVATYGGSFLKDALPNGADVVSLVRIVHDHDDESALALLRAAHAALPAGGTILVAEPMAGTPGAEPIGDAYFGFYLLAMGRGRARTVSELSALLKSAGFAQARAAPTRRPMLTGLVIASRV